MTAIWCGTDTFIKALEKVTRDTTLTLLGIHIMCLVAAAIDHTYKPLPVAHQGATSQIRDAYERLTNTLWIARARSL